MYHCNHLHSPVLVNFILNSSPAGFSSDYILKFPSGSVSYLLWPNILTELKAFSVCLWLRFQPLLMGTKDRSMILFQYRGSNGNATIKYSLTWGTLKTTIWSRYDTKFTFGDF